MERRRITIHIVREADKIRGRGAAAGKGRQSVRSKQRALGRNVCDNIPGAASPWVSAAITQG